ncbi:hypothetical protein BC829DRAFT_400257 [Chytridium lagenaria]|nr:hypothetical protein BC829DRAFT_400257 [Chytridium lagenaria]
MSMTESQKSSLIVVQRLFSEVNNQEEPSTKTAINSSSRDSSKDIPTNPPSTSQKRSGAVTLRLRSVVMTLRNYIRQHKQEPLWERVDSFLSYFFPSWK